MKLELIKEEFTVCQVREVPAALLKKDFCFVGKTDEELSLVCATEDAPAETLAREDGWRCFRVLGPLDFSLVGILAEISRVLADAGVSIFAVSTYNTDYILVRSSSLESAVTALRENGFLLL